LRYSHCHIHCDGLRWLLGYGEPNWSLFFSKPVGSVLLQVVQGKSGKRSILGALGLSIQHMDPSAALTWFIDLDYLHSPNLRVYVLLFQVFRSLGLGFYLINIVVEVYLSAVDPLLHD
jgi:hypothetical protein